MSSGRHPGEGAWGLPPYRPRARTLNLNGLEFLRVLRADPELRTVSVVVLTTSADERDKIDAYNLNVAGYLLKPVTFINFVEVMATLNKYWTLVEMP
ncbi:hypothetical protein ACQKGO_18440 [Corallococcus interemptor]|uniref:hypothetical protein n=1 Tax=Corallococcus interemptor TaxID=2316720 RepID=UPI003D07448C